MQNKSNPSKKVSALWPPAKSILINIQIGPRSNFHLMTISIMRSSLKFIRNRVDCVTVWSQAAFHSLAILFRPKIHRVPKFSERSVAKIGFYHTCTMREWMSRSASANMAGPAPMCIVRPMTGRITGTIFNVSSPYDYEKSIVSLVILPVFIA